MALLDEENGKDRRHLRGPTPTYAKMPRAGRVIIDARRLRYYRHVRFMTRKELGLAARVSWYSIESYEEGRRHPAERAFLRLCTALGIEPADLLFDDCRYIPTEEGESDG